MNGIQSSSPAHTRSSKWVMLKTLIYNLLWLADCQCDGVLKFNLSNLSFWVSFGDHENAELERFHFNLNCGHQNN